MYTNTDSVNIVFMDEVATLIALLSSRPKAEMIIIVDAEAEGRGINMRLIVETEFINDI